jgi:dTDP-4-amino-4,6-dideoxygalactose transaminase
MTFEEDDVEAVRRLMRDRATWFDADLVRAYEEAFARWNGSRYAFAFMGGRVALSAAIHALELQPGNEVVIPGYTCVVVPNAFAFAGVKVVCADIELETYGLDVVAVDRAITPRTRAVMLHHLYGLVCRDYEPILELASRRGLAVIEDCAHATGAEHHAIKVGNRGHIGFYSSEQSKIFTTGQGGIAATNDPALAQRLRAFAEAAPVPDEVWIFRQFATMLYNYYRFKHPQRWITRDLAEARYGKRLLVSTTTEEERGLRPVHYGRKMPGAIAAVGIRQLGKIDRFNALRREVAERWNAWCDRTGHKKPLVLNGSVPVFLRYPVMATAEQKRDPRWAESELGLHPGVWFLSNFHPVPVTVPNCPNADRAVTECVNFPTLLR